MLVRQSKIPAGFSERRKISGYAAGSEGELSLRELINFCYLSTNDKQYCDYQHLKYSSSGAKYSICLTC